VGGFADNKVVADFDAELAQTFDFFHEVDGINHDAVADDAELVFAENAGWHQVQDVFFFANENSVAGVVAAGVTHNDIGLLREHVDDFAFAFVTPLGSD
jgi:hypothetical protein